LLLVVVKLTHYSSGDKIEKNGTGVACSAYGGEERPIQGFVGKPEGKRLLGRPRFKWKDNIKMDLQEVGCGVWTGSSWLNARDRWRALGTVVMNLRVQ
jgi:hypothetical protein